MTGKHNRDKGRDRDRDRERYSGKDRDSPQRERQFTGTEAEKVSGIRIGTRTVDRASLHGQGLDRECYRDRDRDSN